MPEKDNLFFKKILWWGSCAVLVLYFCIWSFVLYRVHHYDASIWDYFRSPRGMSKEELKMAAKMLAERGLENRKTWNYPLASGSVKNELSFCNFFSIPFEFVFYWTPAFVLVTTIAIFAQQQIVRDREMMTLHYRGSNEHHLLITKEMKEEEKIKVLENRARRLRKRLEVEARRKKREMEENN